MKTVSEKLKELNEDMSPMAMIEDWVYGVSEFLGTISDYVAKNKWKLLHIFDKKSFGTDYDLEFRQLNNNLDFVLGYFCLNESYTNIPMERFVVVMKLDCSRVSTFERFFNTKKLIKVNAVALLEELQGRGIVSSVYKFLVNTLGYTLLSDRVQYNGARKLWNRLSNEVEQVTVDVVNVRTKETIKPNAQLNHGTNPAEFNREFWSDNYLEMDDIRFLLRKIN